jgi:hypothetical protein
VRLEGLGQLKNAMTLGIEPMIFQLVAQCLNQLRYRILPQENGGKEIKSMRGIEEVMSCVMFGGPCTGTKINRSKLYGVIYIVLI